MKINYNNSVVNLPDFIVVGAQKSATTTLYKNLKNNPRIYMPEIKEINFFAYNDNDIRLSQYKKYNLGANFKIITNESEHLNLFNLENCENKLVGESSVNYLYRYHKTISKIKKYYGENSRNLKIIISLRNPIYRAFSSWLMNVRDGFDNMSFNDAVKSLIIDDKRHDFDRLETLNYLQFGLYYKAVLKYKENFNNVHVLLYDDIVDNFSLEINKVFEFLDIENIDKDNISNIKYNVSGIPRINFLHNLIKSDFYLKSYIKNKTPKKFVILIKKILNMNYKKPQIDINTKNRLIDYYNDDIKNLESLINRDLHTWLK